MTRCHFCNQSVRLTPKRAHGRTVADMDNAWIQCYPVRRVFHARCRLDGPR